MSFPGDTAEVRVLVDRERDQFKAGGFDSPDAVGITLSLDQMPPTLIQTWHLASDLALSSEKLYLSIEDCTAAGSHCSRD